MKTSKTFSIDIDVWSRARNKYENLSERIEELLLADLEQNKDEKDEANIHKQLKTLKDTIIALKTELASKEKNQEEEKVLYEVSDD